MTEVVYPPTSMIKMLFTYDFLYIEGEKCIILDYSPEITDLGILLCSTEMTFFFLAKPAHYVLPVRFRLIPTCGSVTYFMGFTILPKKDKRYMSH